MANANANANPMPAGPEVSDQDLLANLPQGEELRRLVVEGGLRQIVQLQALLPTPRPKDQGYAARSDLVERNVRAQYLKLMSMEPGKENLAAEARIMLRQWCGAAAGCIFDPLTGRRVD